ncbi:hypothetical protein [Marinobacter lipolyticus]|uniref:hypothetical protein n=1 Tax=Marinobacter lipolyticus TaxID=209639 RepID=UPI003A8F809B
MTKSSIFVATLGLLAACFLTSLFVLPSETSYLDDEVNLAPLRSLEEDPSQFSYLVTNNQSGLFGRSVSMASFGLDVLFFDFSYWQFKVTNSVIHLVNSILVGLFSLLLFAWYGISKQHSRLLAICTSVFWFVLPIHISTVMYPVQRMAQFSAMFMLLGLVFYGCGRNLMLEVGRQRVGVCLIAAALFICLPLGLLSKENAILLLPLMFLVEITFFRRDVSISGKGIRFFWGAWVCISLIFLVFFWKEIVGYISVDYRERTPYQSLLTQTRILFSYLQEIIFSSNSRFGYFHDDVEVSKNLFEPIQTLYSVVAIITSLAICTYFVLSRRSVIAFGILFFFVGHALESSILPLELYFEHRNYLPSVGLVVALILSGYWIARKIKSEALVALFFVGYLAVTAFISVERNIIWNSPDVGIALSEMNHPESPRSAAAFAIYQADTGFYESSLRYLTNIQEIKPSLYSAVEVQKLYAACVNRYPITEDHVTAFSTEFNMGMPQYFNHGLSLLKGAIESGRCTTIEPSALVALSESFLANEKVPASTHERMGELMLAGNQIGQGVEHLLLAWEMGRLDVRSSILLFELLLSREQYDRARMMIKNLDPMVDGSDINSWQVIYAKAKEYLDTVE